MTSRRNILPISNSQKSKIHIAKAQLKLDRQKYEDILSGFIDANGQPCSSCLQLNFEQAETLLHLFTKLGWQEKRKNVVLKYQEYANRDYKFAEPKHMRKIDALWHTSPSVREKTDKAMNNFIRSRHFANHISFLLRKDVHKVIFAIQNLTPSPSQGEGRGEVT